MDISFSIVSLPLVHFKMLAVVLLLFSVLSLNLALDSNIDPFVVNGTRAASGQFTYFVSLRYNFTGDERHGCGNKNLKIFSHSVV